MKKIRQILAMFLTMLMMICFVDIVALADGMPDADIEIEGTETLETDTGNMDVYDAASADEHIDGSMSDTEQTIDDVPESDGTDAVDSELVNEEIGSVLESDSTDMSDVLDAGSSVSDGDAAADEAPSDTAHDAGTDESELPDDVPDEVQVFLDAVDAIPEITPENLPEASGYIYGGVSEKYAALLETEHGDREDVQAAMAKYAAAIEAIDGMMGMLSDTYAEEPLPYEHSKGITKSAFEGAYNLGQSSIQKGIVKLNGKDEYDSGTPNVLPTGSWEGSVNVTGYNWVHIYNTNPDVAAASYSCEGGKLTIKFSPGTSSGTTRISVSVDAQYMDYNLGDMNLNLDFDYAVTNDAGTASGSKQYGTITRSVIYDLSTGKATWGKDPYDNRYGERTDCLASLIFDFKDGFGYWYSFYPTKATSISLSNYDSSIAAVEAYGFTTTKSWSDRDDADNIVQAGTGFKVTGLKPGETVVDITTEYDVQNIRWDDAGTTWSVDDNLAVVTKLYIKVIGETANVSYDLTYDANGGMFGSGDVAVDVVTKEQSRPEFTVSSQVPSLDGYDFLGWADEDDTTEAEYAAGSTIVLTDDVPSRTIYAVWKPSDMPGKALSITKTASVQSLMVGDEVTYTIDVYNPNNKAVCADITDVLDERLEPVWDDEFEMWVINNGGIYDEATRTITWTDEEIPANGNIYVFFIARIKGTGEIPNVADVTWSGGSGGDAVIITASRAPAECTIYHEYYENGKRAGSIKGETISGLDGDMVPVSGLKKAPIYEGSMYGYTRANIGIKADNPYGYIVGDEVMSVELSHSEDKIIVLRYDRQTATEWSVKREYYAGGVLIATAADIPQEGTTGDTVDVSRLGTEHLEWNSHDVYGMSRMFTYSGIDREAMVLDEDPAKNVATLRYDADLYCVRYTDGADGRIFGDETHGSLWEGDGTPLDSSNRGRPMEEGDIVTKADGTKATFTDWSPSVNPTVSSEDDPDGDLEIVYTATWKAHVHEYETVKEPDCIHDGLERCGCGDEQPIAALGHDFDGVEWQDDTDTGEHTEGCGSVIHVRDCRRCHGSLDGGTETSIHRFLDWVRVKEPTCTEDGLDRRECMDCSHEEMRPVEMFGLMYLLHNQRTNGRALFMKVRSLSDFLCPYAMTRQIRTHFR